MKAFEGRDYLVVGGSSGIGLALVERLVAEGAGVSVWSRDGDKPLPDGVTSREALDVTTADLEAVSLPERLHGLAYCVGTITLGSFKRLADETFLHDYTVNVLGAVRTVRRALPSLLAAGGASVVLFSTVAAGTGMGFHSSIAAAKAGVEGLARALAAELASQKIRVNVVAPSITDTPLAAQLLSSDQKRERAAARHPLARVGRPADIAAAAAFLLSRDSEWMTGQILSVDGGLGGLRPL